MKINLKKYLNLSTLFFFISLLPFYLFSDQLAYPRKIEGPPQDPPPSVIWGPYTLPDLRGLDYGLYGLGYNGLTDRLYATYVWHSYLHCYRSTDSTNPLRPETIPTTGPPYPVMDSIQDMYYCHYDNSIWLHSSKRPTPMVYKIDARTGQLLRQFPTPATRWGTGIAFNEREKLLYLVDRMYEREYPCTLYITDTLGNVLERKPLNLGYSDVGARCLDFDYTNSNPNWPTLLLIYTYFRDVSGGVGILDSVVLFELNRFNAEVIHRQVLPGLGGYSVNNIRGVAWDPRNGDYWIGIMQNPLNNIYKMDGWHTPLSTDVGLTALIAPRGLCSLGMNIVPRVCVRNFGNSTVTCSVRMRIGDPPYLYNEIRAKTLAAGKEDTVNFPLWIPDSASLGYQTVKCTTKLTGDGFSGNDFWVEEIQVGGQIVRDVGVKTITQPPLTVDSGYTYPVRCSVKNYGTVSATCSVYFYIGDFYTRVEEKTLLPGNTEVVDFPAWTVQSPRGGHSVRCSTHCAYDQNPNNNFREREQGVWINVHDVGATAINSPPASVDSGQSVPIIARVKNFGTYNENFTVWFHIGSFYSEQRSKFLTPDAEDTVNFPDWLVSQPRGQTYPMRCSTRLASDKNPVNNYKTGNVSISLLDVGVSSILSPHSIIPPGAYNPKVVVENYGSLYAENFRVICHISKEKQLVYADTSFRSLLPGRSDTIEFKDWVVSDTGTYQALARTELTGDMNPENDEKRKTITVLPPKHDVGVIAINSPPTNVDSGQSVPILARVKNFGTYKETFDCRFHIGDFYSELRSKTLLAGDEDTVNFPNWQVLQTRGTYPMRCSTHLASDDSSDNNYQAGDVLINVRDVGLVQILSPKPTILPGTYRCSVEVKNYGSLNAENFRVIFQIISSDKQLAYADTEIVSLLPGQLDTVLFDKSWNATLGTYNALSKTELSGDANPTNDEKTRTIRVIYMQHDVGVSRIICPTGEVPPGPTNPKVYVKNYGAFTETDFPVIFWIEQLKEPVYADTVKVAEVIEPGDSALITFRSWHAGLGAYKATSWSRLTDDVNPQNDSSTTLFEVIRHDVATSGIIAPSGEIGVGFPITPKAIVKNLGSVNENFPVVFQILSTETIVYGDTQNVSLPVGKTDTVEFKDWIPTVIGDYNTKTWTNLSTDQDQSNDTTKGEVRVVPEVHRDVGVVSIIYPTGNVPPGNIQPRVKVKNYGNVQEPSFKVFFFIHTAPDQEYTDSLEVQNLSPQMEYIATFTSWLALPGNYTTLCSTYLAEDENPVNDTLRGSFTVFHYAKDCGVTEILYPSGNIEPGTQVRPRIKVHNFGDNSETFKAYFRIYSGPEPFYTDSVDVELLPPNTTRELTFTSWLAVSGSYEGVANTVLPGDENPTNDTLRKPFTVLRYNYDVGPTRIVSPIGIIQQGNVIPSCTVYNFGNRIANFKVFFIINSGLDVVYYDSAEVTNLAPDRATKVSFKVWSATIGNYQTLTYTQWSLDENRTNDSLKGTVIVRSVLFGWGKVGDVVPRAPDNKRIKSGGGMTKCGNYLYILKGNNTRSFYKYLPEASAAQIEDTVPLGEKNKRVKKGSGITSDGQRYIYIVKGGNTREFFRYDTQRGETIWKTLLDVDPGPNNKALKNGTAIAYTPGYVYLLKGSNTKEFYRYIISEDRWEVRNGPPRAKGFKDGSCLVAYDDTLLYLLGDRYNNFYRYNTKTNTWDSLKPMPLSHPQLNRNKKVKEGAALTVLDGKIYAFKGGNTGEFWVYYPIGDSWKGKAMIPKEPDGKLVKGGAALVTFGQAIWALKGNNTVSIWKYIEPPTCLFSQLPNEGSAGEISEVKKEFGVKSRTNPTTPVTIFYNLPTREVVTLRIYNSLGELVYSEKTNQGFFSVRKLPPGIYILRFSVSGYEEKEKLIIVGSRTSLK